ncbi:MAG TPA: queuosine precursor transporter [Candidatus Paceibacterota bacterium]|nr:queuosine precursor transporter [Candidatus Paceibacterota bacterium]
MSPFLLLMWVVGVTSFTLLGSLYARRYERPGMLIGLYVAFVLTAQMLATKIAYFDFGALSFSGPAGILVFSVTFLLLDIVNEKFGRAVTQRMIFTAFAAQVASTFFLWLGTQFDPDSTWASTRNAHEWNQVFGAVPRITLASWIAFLVSENIDAYIFDRFRRATGERHLWLRNVVSTIPALLIDSLLFIPIAFAGTGLPLLAMIKGQVAMKWIVGIVNIPFMYLNHAILFSGRGTPDRHILPWKTVPKFEQGDRED